MGALPAQDITYEQLMDIFRSSIEVFNKMQMPECAKSVENIRVEGRQKMPNRTMINQAFLVLQHDMKKEFCTSDYKTRLYDYLHQRVSAAMERHHDRVVLALNTPGYSAVPRERLNIFTNLNTFMRLLFAGAKTDEENSLAGSFIYSYAVEGIYKLSLRDSYVWEKLGTGQNVDTETVVTMDIMNVHDYYVTNKCNMVVFEGYENTVRNAVAHASFQYDAKDGMTSYIDKRKGTSIRYSFKEIEDRYQKLKELYQYILLKNVLINIGDVCTMLLNASWKH